MAVTRKITGRGGPIAWPARSLTPFDFYLWGHLKSSAYDNNTIDSLATLKNRIIVSYDKIRQLEFASITGMWN
ncbi:hypothetical protein WH47_02456 [Habropoda laboriosa]|uniref:Histone-lysine N-methyltransferase SETMAR n=1 Tax=Habropoda laboriosa TaxID=597456 RepID=A0A0L7QWL8_9HYME|nr:hypothetical protein WH47_02456 [Habropoda laboriosa]